MTEAEWLAATDPTPMLDFIHERASNRKVALYLCGGCRSRPDLFYSPSSITAIDLYERNADGLLPKEDKWYATWYAEEATFGFDFEPNTLPRRPEIVQRLVELGAVSASALSGGAWVVNEEIRQRLHYAAELVYNMPGVSERLLWYLARIDWPGRWLFDCVFGNPFRPVSLDPAWLTSTVVALAGGIYADRAFDRMPILADALQDAGCDHDDILTHCRGDSPHVRGCWVVDLLTGRA
jgi:hypothetical protein